MAGLDDVLERLAADPAFREQLRADPATALSGYVLYDEDLAVLAATLDEFEGDLDGTEQRMSKSAFLAAITGLLEPGSGGSAPDTEATSVSSEEEGRGR